MEQLKLRCNLILSITSREVTVADREDFSAELACLNLRKVLELLAFASLIANKEKYAEAHETFARHWKAKSLLTNLERLHPDFYPTPIAFGEPNADGIKTFVDVKEPYLTRDDFEFLYDQSSQLLHTQNPYGQVVSVLDFRLSLSEWVHRIQTLLSVHYMRLVGSTSLWVVMMQHPEDGKVHVFKAEPRAQDAPASGAT
jgi:hypothetical protein